MQRPAITTIDDLPVMPPGVFLIDSHCHLDFDSFEEDLQPVIDRAHAAGVRHMITIGASGPFAANQHAIQIADTQPSVSATVGIHPHEAASVSEDLIARIESMARHPKVVAIGETGLDYHYDHSPRDRQRAAFRRFLNVAKDSDLPVSIHLRNADEDAAAIVRDEGLGSAGGVIHCFSSDTNAASNFLDLGLHISFSGIVTFRSADSVREAARAVPLDRMLVETDSPFLAPIPHRGRRNEPALVTHTAALLAEIRNQPVEQIAAATTANAEKLFHLKQHRA